MNIKRLSVTLILLTALAGSPEMAQAQVFDSGPSDPALSTTVFNLPPDPNLGNNRFISGSTQLNVSDGGRVGSGFGANEGSEVNIWSSPRKVDSESVLMVRQIKRDHSLLIHQQRQSETCLLCHH